MKGSKRKWVVFGALAICVAGLLLLYDQARNSKSAQAPIFHPNGQPFAGSARCVSCHSDIYKSHQATAHFNTSSVAAASTIKGSFEPGRNVYAFNARDKMIMSATDSGFYQAGYSHDRFLHAQRFDLVIGSGTKGQSYLH
ncbi:MAG: hypothetical protein ACKORJ_13490 [Bacteroidota bacterium]